MAKPTGRPRQTLEWFIEKATAVHNGLYTYPNAVYEGTKRKIEIYCPEHGGSFFQTAQEHLRGSRCTVCYGRSGYDFVEKARAVHGDRYLYDRVEYTGSDGKVEVGCREHGYFFQRAVNHLSGGNCPKCNKYSTKDLEYYLTRAREIHGDTYDYSQATYSRTIDETTFICPTHGEFRQTWHNHVHLKHGCQKCGSGHNKFTHEGFVGRARDVHGDTYEYISQYINAHTPLEIRCKHHGVFTQRPYSHLGGQGCPSCKTIISKPHQALLDLLVDTLGDSNVIPNDRKILDNLELDILLPEHNLAIEVDGLFWHTTQFLPDKKYHQNKQDSSSAAGIELLQFWDVEVLNKLPIVESMIRHRLGITESRVYARKCRVEELSTSEYKSFLTDNHIQGALDSSMRFGLYHGDELVSVLGATYRRGKLTIDRFASRIYTSVVGAFGRLFSQLPHVDVYTHSANRYSTGDVYKAAGFELVSEYPHTLYFTDGTQLFSRNRFQKHRLVDMAGYSPEKTAETILAENKIYPIYAAGTKTWKLSR